MTLYFDEQVGEGCGILSPQYGWHYGFVFSEVTEAEWEGESRIMNQRECSIGLVMDQSVGLNSYFDELGRVEYEYNYVTHGVQEWFYIYSDESEKPDYVLMVDPGWGLEFTKY